MALALALPASVAAQSSPTSRSAAPMSSSSTQASRTASSPATKGFAAVHIGGQAGTSDLVDTFTFTVYDEVASVSTDQEYGGDFLFNVEGGYQILDRLSVGLAITRTSGEISAPLTASIPHPRIFDAPRTATLDVADANHSETGFHFFASYLFPVTPMIDVRVFAGPSVYNVSHDLVSAIEFEEAEPFTSVTLTGTTLDERSETVAAFHVGAGATYHLTDRFGIDGFFRYARRTVDVAAVQSGEVEIKVGGAQLGVGVRVGF